MFFFFKQKSAYEMRISDWSSDVCSSDLQMKTSETAHQDSLTLTLSKDGIYDLTVLPSSTVSEFGKRGNELAQCFPGEFLVSKAAMRSEERRVGKECVSKCRSGCWSYH